MIAKEDERSMWKEISKVKDLALDAGSKANIVEIRVNEYHKEKNNCLVFCKEHGEDVAKLNIWQAEQNKENEQMSDRVTGIEKTAEDIAKNTKNLPLTLIKINTAMFGSVLVILGLLTFLMKL